MDDGKLYECLGLPPGANAAAVKAAYRKVARVTHPDKGGDPDVFKAVSAAHEVLSDPATKQLYDTYGLAGLEDEGDDGGRAAKSAEAGLAQFFDMMMGAGRVGGQRQTRSGLRKGKNVVYPLKVTLADLYVGKTKSIAITRQVVKGNPTPCDTCHGTGHRTETQALGPALFTQVQVQCEACRGHGFSSAQLVKERSEVKVLIAPGMKDGSRIVLKEAADDLPGGEAGDVVFIIHELAHPFYKRRNGGTCFDTTRLVNAASPSPRRSASVP